MNASNKCFFALWGFCSVVFGAWVPTQAEESLVLMVMDPLSEPLSCDCVEGYAQRKYQALGDFLAKQLKQPVKVIWNESLMEGMKKTEGAVDLVIGKHSVVLYDAAQIKRPMEPIARLTGSKGTVVQQGLWVVRDQDPALTVADLNGYRLFFGPVEAEEKSAAPMDLLKKHHVAIPNQPERFGACSEAATALLKLPDDVRAAAVISSYAAPLLEGCGAVKKGELRVIGTSKDVPFITAFIPTSTLPQLRTRLIEALDLVSKDIDLMMSLETSDGFIPWESERPSKGTSAKRTAEPQKNKVPSAPGHRSDWFQFRGPTRDGRVAWLPDRLPQTFKPVWQVDLPSRGIGGIAVADGVVIVGSRNLEDTRDLFQAFEQQTGKLVWEHTYLAEGELDYGNSPRATPLVHDGCVYTLGALGELTCIEVETGVPFWSRNYQRHFEAPLPIWGFSGSPILCHDRLVVQPGGPKAGLIALDLITGDKIWKAPGREAAYASLIHHSGQLIGLDHQGIVGWSDDDGSELWRITPRVEGDFGVPTPLAFGPWLLLTSENNGTRLHRIDKKSSHPLSETLYHRAAPNTHTPVTVGDQIFIVDKKLYGLSIREDLKASWTQKDRVFRGYCSLLASENRLLAMTESGELILLDFAGSIIGRLKLSTQLVSVLSHPALVDGKLYARVGRTLICLALDRP